MTKEQVAEAVRTTPFRPFAVRMADGSRYQVPSPDHVSLNPGGRILIVHADNYAKILDVALITEIEAPITP